MTATPSAPSDLPAGWPHPLPHPERPSAVVRISAGQLGAWLASPAPPLLLDVRSSDQRAIARLTGDTWIPLEQLPERRRDVPTGRPLVVYCHYGGIACRAAQLLDGEPNREVAVLEGGIDEYARLVDPTIPRYRDDASESWVVQQFPNLATGCLAYLVRDRSSDEAIVIDPGRDVRGYLEALRAQGLQLRAIVETHTHADHLSGHAELHARTGAPIWLSARSPAQYPHRVVRDGEAIGFGASELAVWETPGHTKDHLSLRLPGAVFTGDTLLPGSCGRTDLGDGDPRALWESLTDKLLNLSDETEVFSAHYGHLHGLPPPERYSSTIGFERRTNEALTQTDPEAFHRYMTEGWPPKPPSFDQVVLSNLST